MRLALSFLALFACSPASPIQETGSSTGTGGGGETGGDEGGDDDSGEDGGDEGGTTGDEDDTGGSDGGDEGSDDGGDEGGEDGGDDGGGTGSGALDSYVVSTPANEVAEIASNLSGITWNPVTQTLVAVLDSNRQIYELDADMSVLRAIDLDNVDHNDTEDIVWVDEVSEGVHRYAVVTEDNVVYLGEIPDDGGTELDFDDWQQLTFAAEPESRNRGGEGIAYDADTQTLYACKEKDPMAVYAFGLPSGSGDHSYEDGGLVVTEPFDAETAMEDIVTDISACRWDDSTDHLWLMSHESRAIIEVDATGAEQSRLDLLQDGAAIGKPEGMAVLDDGTLVVVGEPNEWQLYSAEGTDTSD